MLHGLALSLVAVCPVFPIHVTVRDIRSGFYVGTRRRAELPTDNVVLFWIPGSELPVANVGTIRALVSSRHPLDPDESVDILAVLEVVERPITVIDFDDVRDPETGAVTDEVMALVDQLVGYTELSSSGRGVHVFVRAGLPTDVHL